MKTKVHCIFRVQGKGQIQAVVVFSGGIFFQNAPCDREQHHVLFDQDSIVPLNGLNDSVDSWLDV